MTFASADTLDQRVAILRRLTVRNRVVGVLRIALPAAGVVALAALAAQIAFASMLHHYGVAGLRIDRGKIIVELPQYSGLATDGTHYMLTAKEAAAAADNTDLVDLTGADFVYARPGQPQVLIHAENATFDSATQKAVVPGVAAIQNTDGLHGTLTKVTADLNSQLTIAEGPVDLTFSDGTHLTGASMRRDVAAGLATFQKATLIVPDLPASALRPIPGFANHGWVAG